jgi:hypothetical protein
VAVGILLFSAMAYGGLLRILDTRSLETERDLAHLKPLAHAD